MALALAVAGIAFAVAVEGGSYRLAPREELAIALWWAIGLCVALGLWPVDTVPRAALVAGGLLAAFGLLTGLSAAWTPGAERALTEVNRITLYLGVFAVGVLVPRRGRAGAWLDGLAVGLTAIAALALLSRLFPDLVGTTTADRTLENRERLTYPLDYWNGLGMLAGLAVPLLLRAATTGRAEPWRGTALAGMPVIAAVIYLTSSRGAVAVAVTGIVVFVALTERRILATVATVVGLGGSLVAVLVLRSRDALVSAAGSPAASTQGRSAAVLIGLVCLATSLVYAAGAPIARRPLRVGRPIKTAVAVLAGASLVALVIAADPRRRLEDFKQPPGAIATGDRSYVEAHLFSGGGSGRWQFWDGALDAWRDSPVGGQGAGSFEWWWAKEGSISYFIRDAHSLWLETLAELGVPGLALLALFFAVPVAAGVARLRRAPPGERAVLAALLAVVAAFAVGAAVDWMWELTAVTATAVLCLGLSVGGATASAPPRGTRGHQRARTQGPAPEGRPRPSLPVAGRLAVPVVALLLVLSHAAPLLAQRSLQESAAAAGRSDIDGAAERALDARSLQPWTSAPPLQLALAAERVGDLRAARRWAAEAVDRNPGDWRLWLTSARIVTAAGDLRTGSSQLRRARSLNPRSPIFARR